MSAFFNSDFNPWHTLPALSLVLAVAGVLILGISKSGFGGGLGIVAVPMFAIAFGAKAGNGILLPLLIACDIFSVYHHWKKWDHRILKVLWPGTLLGISIGAGMLYVMLHHGSKAQGERALNLVTGIVCILYVLVDFVRVRWAKNWHFRPTLVSGTLTGAAVGVVSTLANAAGPVAAIFLLGQGLAKQMFVGTMVIYFLAVNTIKLVPYGCLGQIDVETLIKGLWLAPLVLIGTWLGARLFHLIPEIAFRRIILAVTLATGLQLVYVNAFARHADTTQPVTTMPAAAH